MQREKEQKNKDNQVISPLANEKTYGERMYSRVFDWGLNYWANLLSSAVFSQWAEHSEKPFKLPQISLKNLSISVKETTPREWQQSIATHLREKSKIFNWFAEGIRNEMVGQSEKAIQEKIYHRSMARARSLILLIPGFFIMIPSVWLGAKFKPQLVEWWNKRHYGEDAMDDPSLQARHAAIAAEERPTLFGAITARFATVVAAQVTAQMFGSDKNWLQKAGFKNFEGIDPFTEKLGSTIGSTLPRNIQQGYNRMARSWGYNWSIDQRAKATALQLDVSKPYYNAVQDLGRFVVTDTVYTAVTASTIGPIAKLLPKIPLIGRFMSYTPKVARNSPTLDGDRIKIPANRYTDNAPETSPTLDTSDMSILDASAQPAPEKKPVNKVQQVQSREMLAQPSTPQLSGAGA